MIGPKKPPPLVGSNKFDKTPDKISCNQMERIRKIML